MRGTSGLASTVKNLIVEIIAHAKTGVAQVVEQGLENSHQSFVFCHKEHTQCADGLQTDPPRFARGRAFVNQNQVSVEFSSKDDGFAFAGIEFISEQLHSQHVLCSLNDDPIGGGQRCHAGFVLDFCAYGGRNENSAEETS